MLGERDPRLRRRTPRNRIEKSWVGLTHSERRVRALEAFRASLRMLGTLEKSPPNTQAPVRELEPNG
jgi:hypothetical protein